MFETNAVCASGSAVEHLLAKERVAGSIPVSRFRVKQKDIQKDILFVLSRHIRASKVRTSTFHFGRRKADVPRTSCDVSSFLLSFNHKTPASRPAPAPVLKILPLRDLRFQKLPRCFPENVYAVLFLSKFP